MEVCQFLASFNSSWRTVCTLPPSLLASLYLLEAKLLLDQDHRDPTWLMNLLAEDVTFWGDGGGKVRGAATHPITGREAVARFLLETGSAAWQSLPQGFQVELAAVNGQPALITRAGSRPLSVLTIEVEAGQIRTIRLVGNPEKLTHV